MELFPLDGHLHVIYFFARDLILRSRPALDAMDRPGMFSVAARQIDTICDEETDAWYVCYPTKSEETQEQPSAGKLFRYEPLNDVEEPLRSLTRNAVSVIGQDFGKIFNSQVFNRSH